MEAFPFSHLALCGQNNVVIRTRDGTGELAEDDGFFGDRGILLQTVVPVVHAHTHHFLWGQDGGQQLDVCSFNHKLARRQSSEEEEHLLEDFHSDYLLGSFII